MIVQCPKCRREFHAKPSAKRKYCSRACKEAVERRIDLAKLADLVAQGAKHTYMAAVFGVSCPRITHALWTHGLHAQWKARRANA